jgi:ribonuclease VapC
LQAEPGGSIVEQSLGEALISTVNLAEVMTKLLAGGEAFEIARGIFDKLGISIVDFTRDLAEDAGYLVVRTSAQGLSLGDRACMALARREKLPVMTTDRAWQDVDAGVRVNLIR